MKGKFDSYRDSALHYLCRAEWCNESFGDVSTYGVFIDRISNTVGEVSGLDTEFNSVFEEWEKEQSELEGTLEMTFEEFRKSLVGHFMVSENSQGQVTVKEFPTQGALISQFNAMRDHFDDFMAEEDEEEEHDSPSRIQEEHEYKFGDDRL